MNRTIKLRNKEIFLLILFFVILKLSVLFSYKFYGYKIFNLGGDANNYHSVAIRLSNNAANYWPVILRYLNDFGLYDRSYITFFLVFLAFFLIPLMIGKLAIVNNFPKKQYVILFLFIIITIYPNVLFLSSDIYRDVFMIFVFLIGLFIIKDFLKRSISMKVFYFFIFLFIGYFLFLLRPYLGVAYLVALLIVPFYSLKKHSFFVSILFLLVFLQIAQIIGFLEPIINYRRIFENIEGGSNIGIVFDTSIFFIPKFLQSFLYQMFGFYFPNIISIVVFFVESVPFFIALVYLIKNRKYSDKYVDFLILFFTIYGVVWLLGNDNLGTATRLRMFNYIVIYIACFIVYQNKYIYQKISKGL